MNWRISCLICVIGLLFSCKEKAKETVAGPVLVSYHSSKHLIEAEELQLLLEDEFVKIIDFRKTHEYEQGHIRNALNLWRSDIENKNYPYAGMIASRQELESVFSSLGVTANDMVIIYDNRGLCDASRLWWALKTYNFENVRLLNGGWSAWNSIDGDITKGNPKLLASPSDFYFTGVPSFDLSIDKEQLQAAMSNGFLTLIDTRTADEYSGKRLKSGAKKAGRISGSINKDWMDAVAMDSSQKFRSREVLEEIYRPHIESKDELIVAYCHTGVRSAHTTFVLTELLGYTNVKNYDGSWSEWSYFDDLPIEKDSSTTIY